MKSPICVMFCLLCLAVQSQTLELTYSTYLGGSQDDRAHGITCNANGNVYLTAPGGVFPLTENAFQTQNTGMYAAVMNTKGQGLTFSTYLGVPGGSNYAHGVALDEDGNMHLVGNTTNPNFPTTEGVYDRTFHGPTNESHGDAFVMKLSPDGSQVIYSTFIGGSGMDIAGKIAVDSEGNAIIVGCTGSSDLPVTESAFDRTFHGGGEYGREDVFVAKLNPDGSALVFCTYIGGNGTELYDGIAVDDAGSIYVYGTTTSTDFPVTDNALSATYNGGSGEYGQGDAYIVKLSSDGSVLEYGSYIGGSQDEAIKSIVMHEDGGITLGGGTNSTDFPVTENAWQNQCKGMQDGFILTLSPELNTIEYATYLGGSQNDYLFICETNSQLILSGETESDDFPVTSNAYQAEFKGNSDQIVAIVDPLSHDLIYSTYFGGSGYDWGQLCVSNDRIYLAGHTTSRDFPLTEDAYDTSYNGGGSNRWGGDVFVAAFKISNESSTKTGVLPYQFNLGQNYPNPFNPSTTIPYSLQKAGSVYLSVFNSCGQQVQLLEDAYQTSGHYTRKWDGKDDSGNPVSSGIYLVQLAAHDQVLQKKMLLVR